MIHTKLHIVHEIITGKNFDGVIVESEDGNVEAATEVVEAMLRAPKYCIDEKVIELLRREGTSKSIMAVMEAGIARLPFSPMLVEYPSLLGNSRYFVLLMEVMEGEIAAWVARLGKHDDDDTVVVQATPVDVGLTPEGFAIAGVTKDDKDADQMTVAAAIGVAIALLMLNTRGLDKEVIHTDRINKARAKHPNKAPVPHHTVVRIGTIYDRSGKGHSVTGTGRHMPVHLRAGHTRQQHHGKGNEQVKLIYIPPCVVNFRDSDGEKPRLPDKTIVV